MHRFQQDFLNTGSKSDKLSHHGYHRIYPWFLAHFRNQPINLLEIGLHELDSIQLWKNYFPLAKIHGIDIQEKSSADPEVELHQLDQSKPPQLQSFAKKYPNFFDLIIDDGSHVPAHQLATVEELWQTLKPGGLFIIEDIETSYWGRSHIYGYEFNSRSENTIRTGKEIIDVINREFHQENSSNDTVFSNEIEIAAFAHNCLIFVKKDLESFADFYEREYRLAFKKDERSLTRRISKRLKNFFNL